MELLNIGITRNKMKKRNYLSAEEEIIDYIRNAKNEDGSRIYDDEIIREVCSDSALRLNPYSVEIGLDESKFNKITKKVLPSILSPAVFSGLSYLVCSLSREPDNKKIPITFIVGCIGLATGLLLSKGVISYERERLQYK